MLDKPATGQRTLDRRGPTAFALPAWAVGPWGLGAASELRWNAWNGKAVEGLASLGNEWLDFVHRRLKADIDLLPRLAACRCAEEVSTVYAEFWRNLGDDYVKELGALSKLSGDLVTGAFTAGGQKPQS
jgi:hypothetical protein